MLSSLTVGGGWGCACSAVSGGLVCSGSSESLFADNLNDIELKRLVIPLDRIRPMLPKDDLELVMLFVSEPSTACLSLSAPP
jgi:hypothetical protein